MSRRNNTPKYTPTVFTKASHTKRRFSNEQEALKAADLGMLQNIHLTFGVYKCDQCSGWHLTTIKGSTDQLK
jgi:hypothetical protein